jgi:DNA-binding IscR family transcriptional regulator
MAGSVNTNPVFVRRILGFLHRTNLVVSQPGVGGGWQLCRDPEVITLLTVYRAVHEGDLLAMHSRQPNPDGLVGRNIQEALTFYFHEAELAFEQTLAQQTIAQVLQTILHMPHKQAS